MKKIAFIVLFFTSVQLFGMELQYINIQPPYDKSDMEYSGLTKLGDKILFLPQYPKGFILSQTKENILNVYEKKKLLGLEKVEFDDSYFKQEVCKSEGYEAIACEGEYCYFTVEARSFLGGMMGYLLKAKVENNKITVVKFIELPIYNQIDNASYEAIILHENKVLLFYEGNGANLTKEPYYLEVSRDLEEVKRVPFISMEYRLTDATKVGDKFYFINYLWLGDKLNYRVDNTTHVEDIVVLNSLFRKIETILLPLETVSRNWEGIVGFEDGFLLITDKFPETKLVYLKQ